MTNRTNLSALAAVLLVAAAVAGAVPAVGAQISERDAALAIQQESYADGAVSEKRVNGSRVYVASGEELTIKPQNFNSSNVVDYGVNTPSGQLTYADEFDTFTFRPEGETGTFELYWVVQRREVVETTENNTTTTETVTRQYRYTASIRITGQTGLVHISKGSIESLRADAKNWREFNASVQDIRGMDLLFLPADATTEDVIQGMIETYITVKDPPRAFGGGFTGFFVFIVASLGGAVAFGSIVYFLVRRIRKERKKRNEYESLEAAEGELAEREREDAERERTSKLQNINHSDWFNDHVADAFDERGRNPRESWESLSRGELLPEVWIRDRLQAMAQCGYAANVLDRDDDGEFENVELVEVDDVLDEDEDIEDVDGVVPIADPTEDFMDALDWEDPLLKQFDPASADFDPGECATKPVTLDLEELSDTVDVQMSRFDDEQTRGQYLLEFVESVREHPYTDTDGRPRPVRQALSEFLQMVQLVDAPLAEYQRQNIEAALEHHDKNEQAAQFAAEVEAGKHV